MWKYIPLCIKHNNHYQCSNVNERLSFETFLVHSVLHKLYTKCAKSCLLHAFVLIVRDTVSRGILGTSVTFPTCIMKCFGELSRRGFILKGNSMPFPGRLHPKHTTNNGGKSSFVKSTKLKIVCKYWPLNSDERCSLICLTVKDIPL